MPEESFNDEFADKGTADQNVAVIGAIRYAIAGAANDESAMSIIKKALEYAPETPGNDTLSVRLFLRVLSDVNGKIEVA